MRQIDVHKLADEAKFNRFHGGVLLWCALIIIFDGYDLAVAGIAVPSIMKEMGVTAQNAGFMVSSALFGMMFGAIFLGTIADRIGRRKAIAICIALFKQYDESSNRKNQYRRLVARLLERVSLGQALALLGVDRALHRLLGAHDRVAVEHGRALLSTVLTSYLVSLYVRSVTLGGASSPLRSRSCLERNSSALSASSVGATTAASASSPSGLKDVTKKPRRSPTHGLKSRSHLRFSSLTASSNSRLISRLRFSEPESFLATASKSSSVLIEASIQGRTRGDHRGGIGVGVAARAAAAGGQREDCEGEGEESSLHPCGRYLGSQEALRGSCGAFPSDTAPHRAPLSVHRGFRGWKGSFRPGKWEKRCIWGCVVGDGGLPSQTRAGVEGLLPLLHLGSQPPFTRHPMATFRGTFDYTLDAKNRLTVPARFRAALAEGVVMAKGTEPCVALWTPEAYDAYTESILSGYNPLSEEADKIQRFFAANSHDTELDSAGRVGFPPFLLEHANLKKDVVVTGSRNRLEVWDRSAWADYNESLIADVKDIRGRLSHAG